MEAALRRHPPRPHLDLLDCALILCLVAFEQHLLLLDVALEGGQLLRAEGGTIEGFKGIQKVVGVTRGISKSLKSIQMVLEDLKVDFLEI